MVGFKDVRSTLNKVQYAKTPKVSKTIRDFNLLGADTENSSIIKGSVDDWVYISTDFLIDAARNISKFSTDRTFFSVPKFVKRQLFTVFREFSGKYLLLFSFLMNNCKRGTYDQVFNYIKELCTHMLEMFGAGFISARPFAKNRLLHNLERLW